MKYDAVIYDIDGTLLDTIQMNMYPLLKIIEEELGQKRTFDEIKYCFSMTGKQTLEHLGIDYERVYPRWVKYVNEYEKGAKPFAGVMDMVRKIHSLGILQAVCSAKTKAQYEIDMNAELGALMNASVLFEDTSKHKPDPAPIDEALRRLNIPKNRALYVGDALADGKAARACGIDFAWAKWAGIEVDQMPVPDYLLLTPDDLWQVIKSE